MKKHIPNFLTCLNLFSGCVAVVMIFRNHLEWAAWLVFAAAFFDLLDGMSARLLHVSSPIGKELDSLADVISFGFVPGAILFKLFQSSDMHQITTNETLLTGLQFFPFIVSVFSALRLAKFNIDTRQSESFIGLPTPANTLFIISFPLILANDRFGLSGIILNPYFILVISVLQSYLLVAEIPLFSLKFKSLSWEANRYQYILLLLAVILGLAIQFAALPLIIFFYVLLSLIKNQQTKAT